MLQTDFGASCMNRASVFEWRKRFKKGRESVRDDERCGRSKEVNTPKLTGQSVRLRVKVNLLSFGGCRKRFRRKRPALFKSGQWHFHQSTTPSLSQTISPSWASRQFRSLPIVKTLLPVTFGYSLSSEAVVMRQLRRWKRLWRSSLTRSHKKNSKGPSRSCWKYKCIAAGGYYFEGD